MGYYTYFSFKVIKDPDNQYSDFINLLKETTGYGHTITEDGTEDCVKWYKWEEDVIKASKKFKNLVVEISGDGEETDDFWHARVCNGFIEQHSALLIYPRFTDARVLTDEEKKDNENKSLSELIIKDLIARLKPNTQ